MNGRERYRGPVTTISPCHVVLAIQAGLAVAFAAAGRAELAGAFLVFALAQAITLIAQRCTIASRR